jgi:hypothetical protein
MKLLKFAILGFLLPLACFADAPLPGNFGLSPNTVLLAASTSSSNVLIPSCGVSAKCTSARFRNTGSVDVFIAIAPTCTLAVAVIPTGSAQTWGMDLAANSVETFSVPDGWCVAGITSSSTANVYITPGTGI